MLSLFIRSFEMADGECQLLQAVFNEVLEEKGAGKCQRTRGFLSHGGFPKPEVLDIGGCRYFRTPPVLWGKLRTLWRPCQGWSLLRRFWHLPRYIFCHPYIYGDIHRTKAMDRWILSEKMWTVIFCPTDSWRLQAATPAQAAATWWDAQSHNLVQPVQQKISIELKLDMAILLSPLSINTSSTHGFPRHVQVNLGSRGEPGLDFLGFMLVMQLDAVGVSLHVRCEHAIE